MLLTPFFIFESFVIAITLSALLAMAVFYFRLLRGYFHIRQQYQELEEKMEQVTSTAVKEMQTQSIKTIRESAILTDELKKELTDLLETSTQKESRRLEQIVSKIEENFTQESLEKIDEFAESMEAKTKQSQQQLIDRSDEAYEQIEKEIEQYRQQRLAQVDKDVMQVIKQLTESVLADSLSVEAQQELLQTALKKVKTAHVS